MSQFYSSLGCFYPSGTTGWVVSSNTGWLDCRRIYASLGLNELTAWPSNYLNQWCYIVKWTKENQFQWNSNQNTTIFIQEDFNLKMPSATRRPFCFGINVSISLPSADSQTLSCVSLPTTMNSNPITRQLKMGKINCVTTICFNDSHFISFCTKPMDITIFIDAIPVL